MDGSLSKVDIVYFQVKGDSLFPVENREAGCKNIENIARAFSSADLHSGAHTFKDIYFLFLGETSEGNFQINSA